MSRVVRASGKSSACKQGVMCHGVSTQTPECGSWKGACCSRMAGTKEPEGAESMTIAFDIVQKLMNGRDIVGNLCVGAAGLKSQL